MYISHVIIIKNLFVSHSIHTGCSIISASCLSIKNFVVLWSWRAEILNFKTIQFDTLDETNLEDIIILDIFTQN